MSGTTCCVSGSCACIVHGLQILSLELCNELIFLRDGSLHSCVQSGNVLVSSVLVETLRRDSILMRPTEILWGCCVAQGPQCIPRPYTPRCVGGVAVYATAVVHGVFRRQIASAHFVWIGNVSALCDDVGVPTKNLCSVCQSLLQQSVFGFKIRQLCEILLCRFLLDSLHHLGVRPVLLGITGLKFCAKCCDCCRHLVLVFLSHFTTDGVPECRHRVSAHLFCVACLGVFHLVCQRRPHGRHSMLQASFVRRSQRRQCAAVVGQRHGLSVPPRPTPIAVHRRGSGDFFLCHRPARLVLVGP
eukprot:m.52465 g.52465  ORF g.52465 m.52465 type:complete len:301 (+) comp15412_c0_seq1:251-1153(+)